MKYIKIQTILFSILLLTGCGAGNQTKNDGPPPEEAAAAKLEIQSRLDAQVNFLNQQEESVGYIEGADFPHFRNELNLIATAIGSDVRIESNNDEEIDNVVSTLQNGVDQLGNEEAVNAIEKLNSSKLIYQVVFQKDLEILMNLVNITSSDNDFNFFITYEAEQLTEKNEINEEIDSTIDVIEFSTLDSLNRLKQETDFYAEHFPKEELNLLTRTIDSLTASVTKQIQILENLKPGTAAEGQSVDQQMDAVIADYEKAETAHTELIGVYGLEE